MAARRAPSRTIEFPANIHQIAADIRRQALQNPDKDPVVPGSPRRRTKRQTAKRSAPKRKRATKARKTRVRKKTRARRK